MANVTVVLCLLNIASSQPGTCLGCSLNLILLSAEDDANVTLHLAICQHLQQPRCEYFVSSPSECHIPYTKTENLHHQRHTYVRENLTMSQFSHKLPSVEYNLMKSNVGCLESCQSNETLYDTLKIYSRVLWSDDNPKYDKVTDYFSRPTSSPNLSKSLGSGNISASSFYGVFDRNDSCESRLCIAILPYNQVPLEFDGMKKSNRIQRHLPVEQGLSSFNSYTSMTLLKRSTASSGPWEYIDLDKQNTRRLMLNSFQSNRDKAMHAIYSPQGYATRNTLFDGDLKQRDLIYVASDYHDCKISEDSWLSYCIVREIFWESWAVLVGCVVVHLISAYLCFQEFHCQKEKEKTLFFHIFQILSLPLVLSKGKINVKWILFAGVFFLTNTGVASSLVHLQTDDIARAESGLTWRHTLPPLTTFTFCVRLYSYRSRYSDYFFSYATADNDNELSFHLKYDIDELRLVCCASRVYHIVPVRLQPLKWFSFCSAVNLTSGEVTFVHSLGTDEQILKDQRKGYEHPLMVKGGGTIILGQDQDEQGGGTDKTQSFNGYMSDLYLTQDVLTLHEMVDYIQCRIDTVMKHFLLMDFGNITEDFILGDATEEKIGIPSCPGSNKMYSVFPEARTYEEANHFCSILNGEMALPLNEDDNLDLYNEGYKYSNKCTEFEKSNGLWIGVTWDPEQRQWQNNHIKERATFNNFAVEIIPSSNVRTICVIAETISESPDIRKDGNWDLELCDKTICTACQFEESTPLKIRGLCDESIFDRKYYVYDRINGRPVFNGMSWTKIAWNNSESAYDFTWTLYQIAEPSVQARMIRKSELEYPIGVHEFEVVGDKCPGRKIKLKLTSCPNGMYTCNDGSCIDISKRCNLELDCTDRGDELDCGTVIIPSGYDKRLPPPKTDSATPAEITIDFIIRLIRKFSLLDSHLVVDFLITRSWYDSRVKYKNLHDSKNLNLIDDIVDVVWYPDVTLLGADNSIANYDLLSTTGWGQRLTDPEPDDENRLEEDVFYSGHGNLLMLEREITVTLMCTFDLTMYPFDSQRCPLIFYVGDYTQHYVSTVLNKLEFSGTRRLLEYRVTGVEYESLIYQNKSGQRIEIVLTNLYGYYISGAYIPTFLLVIISYSTFYFALDDFTNRIMVSLTSLLVLASLFSQIASGLPKTAYMKMIDVWFIFCILSDFVMVMLLAIINTVLDSRHSRTPVQVLSTNGFATKEQVKRIFDQLDPKFLNKIAQIVLPSVLGLFIIIYFGGIAYSLNSVKDTF